MLIILAGAALVLSGMALKSIQSMQSVQLQANRDEQKNGAAQVPHREMRARQTSERAR
jgi:hypothetical protein